MLTKEHLMDKALEIVADLGGEFNLDHDDQCIPAMLAILDTARFAIMYGVHNEGEDGRLLGRIFLGQANAVIPPAGDQEHLEAEGLGEQS